MHDIRFNFSQLLSYLLELSCLLMFAQATCKASIEELFTYNSLELQADPNLHSNYDPSLNEISQKIIIN